MMYQKPFMTITELTKLGFSRYWLNCLAHAKGAPVIRTSPNGKHYFDMSEFDEFAKKNGGIA